MLSKIITLAMVAVLAALLMPSKTDAWGAARVSATRVGPAGGVHHASRTVAAGPRGVYSSGRAGGVGAYGGADGGAYGGAYRGGYRYNYGYGGGAAVGGYRYGYVR
jgi:hypothetical protein